MLLPSLLASVVVTLSKVPQEIPFYSHFFVPGGQLFEIITYLCTRKVKNIIVMNTNFLLHIAVAALLGGVIGLERGYRAKEAGFRTHFLVALGAALFMILSAHGFEGALITENHRLDVSRIAAQVVSGIGFIGAGTIIFQRQMVHGLTTAAGLWVTAAIGMAAGAGMYVLATFTTVLVLIGLEALNWLLPHIGHRNLSITLSATDRAQLQKVLAQLKADGVGIASFSLNESSYAQAPIIAASTGSAQARRYTMKLEIKTSRSKYGEHILHFMTGLEGVDVENIE